MTLTGSSPRLFSLNLLMISPRPCQVSISTRAYEMKFVIPVSVFENSMFARGCGKAWVGDQGMLANPCLARNPDTTRRISLREHKMQWDAQFLCTMDMSKARWISDDNICDERVSISRATVREISVRDSWPCSIACLEARSPASGYYLSDLSSPFSDVPVPQGIDTRQQSWVFDHERHQLCGIDTNAKELQLVFFHKLPKGWMRSQTHAMAISVLEDPAKCHERLHITPGSNYLYNDVEARNGTS